MEQTDLRIKAKKISELDDITQSGNIDYDKSYIIVGYRDGTIGKNFKISLSFILDYLASQNHGIDESELKTKVQELIDANEIIFPILNGPQGPQGPQGQGVDIDWEAMQTQINYMQSLINQYHNDYLIQYNLTHINTNESNATKLSYNESVTLYFNTDAGYVMPNYVEVTGANFDYDKENKSIRIYNPTASNHKIIIVMNGETGHYSIIYNLRNITYSYISTEQSNYQKDDSIRIQLTPETGYKLPNTVSLENATLINYDKNIGTLSFKVSGTGNIKINAMGELNSIYYFVFAADGYDGESILGYDENSMPNGVITVNNKFYSNSACPIDYSESYKFMDDPTESYGEENVWMILPSRYFNKSNKSFLDDNGNAYKLTGGNSGLGINIDIVIDGHIDNVDYVICLIANEGILDYINFTRK